MDVHWITCATKSCGYSPFPMESGFYKRAHRTHEDFRCPTGHINFYPGESDLEALERQLKAAKSNAEWWKAQARRDKRRCPWVECYFEGKTVEGLGNHMRAKHGMPTFAEAREESLT